MASPLKLLKYRIFSVTLCKDICNVTRKASSSYRTTSVTAVNKDQNLPVLFRRFQPRRLGNGDLIHQAKLLMPTTTSYYQNQPAFYWHLQPQRKDNGDNNQPEKLKSKLIKGFVESFSLRRKQNEPKEQKKRVPKLILIQNPFSWLMIKIDFSVLRNIWDPSFHEKEFKFGTKQAISRITHLISTGSYTELNGLLTKAARLSLMRELDRNWSEKQRTLLALKHEDIQISSPRKVYFIRIADKKYCDVDMAFLALKWAPINNVDALIFTEIFARFHREYTPHSIPEWTVAFFKVTRFEVLRR